MYVNSKPEQNKHVVRVNCCQTEQQKSSQTVLTSLGRHAPADLKVMSELCLFIQVEIKHLAQLCVALSFTVRIRMRIYESRCDITHEY